MVISSMIDKIKLHLGCGTVKLENYINIDLREVKGITDLVSDCAILPFAKNSVDEIINFHLIEHFDFPTSKKLIIYWKSLLKPGGKLIVETPNILGMTKRFIDVYEKEGKIRPGYMYGCHDKTGREIICNDNHLWGYTEETLKDLFLELGFTNIILSEGTDYHAREYGAGFTCRIEGVK